MIKTFDAHKQGVTFKHWLSKRPLDIHTFHIDCYGARLIDLNGIEVFENLEYLKCSNNLLRGLPDLSKLTKLKVLDCRYNKLYSLSGIENLYNLENLNCSDNKLTELPDLSKLNSLEVLDYSNNKFKEPADLSKLINLMYVKFKSKSKYIKILNR